jgi:molybdopterin adenylyltransferase
MSAAQSAFEPVRIGIVSVSDRASSGVYADQGLPALQDWLTRALRNPVTFEPRLIPDEQAVISATLIELVEAGCSLVLTTGGTGPAPPVASCRRRSCRARSRCCAIAA